MASELAGRSYVEVVLRDKIPAGMKRITAKLRGLSRSVGAIGGTMLGGAGALAAPLIPAIQKASDFQEVMSKFDTVFGSQSAAVKQWGDEFGNQVGRSEKQVAEFLASSQDLFVPLGFDAGTAESLSKTITGLAVDLASFNNMQDSDALRDLHAALTGSGEVMKKYGVIVSEAAVKQELLNRGIDPRKATDQQKVQSRLNIILAGTTAAQGDAIRTAGSYANQMKRLRAQIDNTLVTIGSALLPTLTMFVSSAGSAVAMVSDWIKANPELVQGYALLAGGLATVGGLLVVIAGSGLALGAVLSGLGTIFGLLGAGLGAVAGTAAFLLSPLGLVAAGVVTAIAAFTDFGSILSSTLESGRKWGDGLMDIFGKTLGGIKKALNAGEYQLAAQILFAGLALSWAEGVSKLDVIFGEGLGAMLKALLSGDLASAGGVLWAELELAFVKGMTAIQTAWHETWAGFGQIFDNVATAIQQGWDSLINGLAQMLVKLLGKAQIFFGAMSAFEKELGFEDGLGTKLSQAVDIDAVGTINALKQDREQQRQQVEAARAAREEQRAAALQRRLAETEKRLADVRAARSAVLSAAADADTTSDNRAARLDELNSLLTKANQATGDMHGPFPYRAPLPNATESVAAASKVAGTFSSSAAALMGRSARKPAEETAKNTKTVAEKAKDMVNSLTRMEGTLAQALEYSP